MIHCTIDGREGYPAMNEKIKVTLENPYVTDSGTYTYEIAFPMDVIDNRRIFGNIHRMDVKKTLPGFEECRLFCDNRLLIAGKGTVTSITDASVKLQIVGGTSRMKYNSAFEKHFIDEMEFPAVRVDTGIIRHCHPDGRIAGSPPRGLSSGFTSSVMVNLTDDGYIGQRDVCAFNPVHDQTNDSVANVVVVYNSKEPFTYNGIRRLRGRYPFMGNLAVQPFLMYVLRHVLASEGFTLRRNDFDRYPWNRLVIASARQTVSMNEALPHWSVYQFLEEVRKLFNASFVFDETAKTVDVISQNELSGNDTVNYECADEYSADYDEDGLSNVATSNIQYALDNSGDRDWRESISVQVQRHFQAVECSSVEEIEEMAGLMTTRRRRTTIFRCGGESYIYAMMPVRPDASELSEQLTVVGAFSPLVRDKESDDAIDLYIVPATVKNKDRYDNRKWHVLYIKDSMSFGKIPVPSVPNTLGPSTDTLTEDDDGSYYVSVQDAMQGDETDTSTDEESSDTMPIVFQSDMVYNVNAGVAVSPGQPSLPGEDPIYRIPYTYNDWRLRPFGGSADKGSLSLVRLPHLQSLGDYASVMRVDDRHTLCVKFITDDIPDPSHLYVFRNKKYVCRKVEIEVDGSGIHRLKTGYFNEILG